MSTSRTSELIVAVATAKTLGQMAKGYAIDSQKAVGERLELIRAAMDWDNKVIAEAIKITPQKWNNYKAGINMIPVPTANRLCSVTGATLDFIYRNERSAISSLLAEKLRKVEGSAKAAKRA